MGKTAQKMDRRALPPGVKPGEVAGYVTQVEGRPLRATTRRELRRMAWVRYDRTVQLRTAWRGASK